MSKSKEIAKQIMKLELEIMKDAYSVIPAVKNAVTSWDGKIINANFYKTLKPISKSLILSYRFDNCYGKYSTFEISARAINRCVCDDCGMAHYVDYDTVIIADYCDNRGDQFTSNRLNAKIVLDKIEDRRSVIEDMISRLSSQLSNVDEIEKDYIKAKAEVEAIIGKFERSVDYKVRQHFGFVF